MVKKSALGKGIASLIQETPNQILAKTLKDEFNVGEPPQVQPEVVKEVIKEVVREVVVNEGPLMVPVSQIVPNTHQPRKIFKDEDLAELSASIKENGVIQPLLVIKHENNYELIAGERRLRASKLAGLDKVPVIVKRASEKDKLVMAIIENVQRSDLNCVEEALAYFQLMEDFKLSQEEVSKKVGKERSTIANFLRILKLPRPVIEMLQKEILSFGHAKVLASVKEREFAIELANAVVASDLSVRELEKLAKKGSLSPKSNSNPIYTGEKLDHLKQTLEQRTGFHFDLATKGNGSGHIAIKFSNEAEFNDIYEYLLKR